MNIAITYITGFFVYIFAIGMILYLETKKSAEAGDILAAVVQALFWPIMTAYALGVTVGMLIQIVRNKNNIKKEEMK